MHAATSSTPLAAAGAAAPRRASGKAKRVLPGFNITLGYTFPANWMSKIGIKSVRVYFACDNVFFASKRKGYDPRTSMGGQGATVALNSVDGTYYSPIRTTSVGLNINF